MPYMYEAPAGRDSVNKGNRGMESEFSRSEAELIKLLNGGGNGYETMRETRASAARKAEQAAERDVSWLPTNEVIGRQSRRLTGASPIALPISSDILLDAASITPSPMPPFICDLLQLRDNPSRPLSPPQAIYARRNYQSATFNGRSSHPFAAVPPDASTLPRPHDDWMYEDSIARAPVHAHDAAGFRPAPVADRHYPSPNDASKGYLYQAEYADQVNFPGQQQHVWSPPMSAWDYQAQAQAGHAYRAPVLPPRYVHLPEAPITPHDTYRYPTSHTEHIYVAPAVPEPSADAINHAFSVWYAGQVIHLLVTPGQFRAPAPGASDEIWGPGGREKDGWLRVGRTPPDYSKNWGRMGMTSTPKPQLRQKSQRRPEFEPRDPYNVAWAHAAKPSSSLVAFITDMIQRMTITPTALVAGVWFLAGLGLHEGDGAKGAKLRQFLRTHSSCEPEAVERRVATLGLILAGKWLDDNSFLTKSWCEVTTIPIKEIDAMEIHALIDLNWSLYVPVASWVDHVNKLFISLEDKPAHDEIDAIVLPIIDTMAKTARDVELDDPADLGLMPAMERRLSGDEFAAADQATSRDWHTFARTYAHVQGSSDRDGYEVEMQDEPRDEFERLAERNVNMLLEEEYVDDDELEVVEDDVEDEEEFLEYDGAKRWLPPASELQRSSSNGSDRSSYGGSYESAGGKRRLITQAAPTYVLPLEPFDGVAGQRSYADWSSISASSKAKSSEPRWGESLRTAHHQGEHAGFCGKCDCHDSPLSIRPHASQRGYPITIEPGVAIVPEPVSEFGYMGAHSAMTASKRWATSAAQW
ncbi:hypothetical protein IAT38_004528 [Cryptococcus sp. DSM 104549]